MGKLINLEGPKVELIRAINSGEGNTELYKMLLKIVKEDARCSGINQNQEK